MKTKEKGINIYIVIAINVILLAVAIVAYNYIYQVELTKQSYAEEVEHFVNQNKEPVFKIGKIMLYSSAYAVDNSENGKLQDIDISQFTDIVVYVDNGAENGELNPENTISEIFIDNIKMSSEKPSGDKIINYKTVISLLVLYILGVLMYHFIKYEVQPKDVFLSKFDFFLGGKKKNSSFASSTFRR